MSANKNGPGGDASSDQPAEAVIEGVFVVDAFPHFQPIRLPAKAFYSLHRQTAKTLDAFVEEHFERFPQRAEGGYRFGR